MAVGTVVGVNNTTKEWGFLRPAHGDKNIYIHVSAIQDAGCSALKLGDKYEYTVTQGRTGRLEAANARVVHVGTVNWFDPTTGDGVISPKDSDRDVPFHITAILDDSKMLKPGDKVEFAIGQGPNGRPAAASVRIVPSVGAINWCDPASGQGYVSLEDGRADVPFRITAILDDNKTLKPGDRVEFLIGPGPEGRPEAVNVRVVSRIPAAPEEKVGAVDWFDAEKRQGFIIPENDERGVFFRVTAIADRNTKMKRGDRVKYFVISSSAGPLAASVRLAPRADEDQPKVFVLAGVKELILREVQAALAPLVLQQIRTLETNGRDWWNEGVCPYLMCEERREAGPEPERRAWFAKKLEDAGWLLRYLRTDGPRDDNDTVNREGPSVWSHLGFGRRFQKSPQEPLNRPDEIEILRNFRNHMSHTKPEEWEEETDRAIAAAAKLFEKLRQPEREQRVNDLINARHLVKEIQKQLAPDFLRRPPGGVLRIKQYERVEELREAYEGWDIEVLRAGAQRVSVEGIFAPRLLLERFRVTPHPDRPQEMAAPLRSASFGWRSDLQAWLFRGLGEWAPSWDLRTSIWAGDAAKPLVGQLVDERGDEGESVCIVLRGDHAREAETALRARASDRLGCFKVKLTGKLFHQIDVEELNRLRGPVFTGKDFCIVIDDTKCAFEPIGEAKSYTGYLWRCIAPDTWISDKRSLHFSDVIFVWEHTELTSPEAVKWSLDSLDRKCEYFATAEDYGGPFTIIDQSDPIVAATNSTIVKNAKNGEWRLSDLSDKPESSP